METWDFCPSRNVPSTLPRELSNPVITLGGWQFSSRPTAPYQRKFRVILHGLRWYLNSDGTFDKTTNPAFNAKRFEEFYEAHETWNPFVFPHQHLGNLTCRFSSAVTVPAAIADSGGLIEALEVTLIHHNPGYS